MFIEIGLIESLIIY